MQKDQPETASAVTPPPLDAYPPAQVAAMVEAVGIKKANAPFLQLVMLGLLAGAFIAFGAMFYTLTVTDSTLGLGPTRLLGGAAFSLGLILVVVAGAELFTGNNFIVMAWADRKVSTAALLRNWVIVYLANALGAFGCVVLVLLSGTLGIGGGAVAETAARIAEGKLALSFQEAFFRGILCNALVCLAVWLCMAAREVVSKVFAILFPITAFVALGFEHSVANFYLIPTGLLAKGGFDLAGFLGNILPVTLGNIVGGSLFVALVYWVCYLRKAD